MDDVFYFTPMNVGLEQIAALAAQYGCETVNLREKGLEVVIAQARDSRTLWVSFPLEDVEPEDRGDLLSAGMRSGFCISHHPSEVKLLVGLLKVVLKQYGGFVGNDEEGFVPRFGLAEIDRFTYG